MNASKGNIRGAHRILVRQKLCAALMLAMVACASPTWAQSSDTQQAYSISAGNLADALDQLSAQSKVQIIYPADLVRGKRAPAISGQQTWRQALEKLLAGSGLEWSQVNGSTVAIRKKAVAAPAARPGSPPSQATEKQDVVGMPAILVQGSRTLNMDIARTRDDPQPYVVFDRETIEQSGARSLEDFLRLRLPQNSQGRANEQTVSAFGNLPQVNLRGLGTGQTLILVDGRRMSPTSTTSVVGPPYQPDINGIPLSAIESIEVLPTTASGIYGGSATGGVINIITRRDYSGFEVKLTYGNTFDTDVARRRIDFGGGFVLGEDTTVSLAGSYSDSNSLHFRDRDFYNDGVERILQTNPALFLGSTWAGATANIRSATGAPLTLRGSNVSLGSAYTHLPAGYAGVASDAGAALVANAGGYNLDLSDTAALLGGGGVNLLSQPTVSSLQGTLRHTFSDRLEGFLEIGASENDNRGMTNTAGGLYTVAANVPTNPFNQAVVVGLFTHDTDGVYRSVSKTERAALGLIYKLPGEWRGTTEYTWNEAKFEFSGPGKLSPTLTSAINQGLVDLFRDPVDLSPYVLDRSSGNRTLEPYVATQTALSTRLSGPLFTLPGGNKAMLSTLLERREDKFREASVQVQPGVATVFPSRAQKVDSAYLEATLPFVNDKNARSGVQLFDLQLSVRHDRYDQDGSTGTISTPNTPIVRVNAKSDSTNPTLGLRYSPVPDLMLRASYGTGFMPPPMTQLTPNAPISSTLADPRRGGQASPVQVVSGGNPGLKAEESESWSAGMVFKPRFVPGLRLSLDYIHLDKTDGISTLPTTQVLQLEQYLPDRVVRAPVEPGDPWGVGQLVSIDATALNLSTVKVEAVDLALDYERGIGGYGSLTLFAMGSWQIHNLTQANEIAPVQELVGAGFANPVKFKGNAGVIWRNDPWTAGWYSRYFHSYKAGSVNQGGDGFVSSQIFHDLNITYRAPASYGGGGLARLFSNMEYQLGIQNVFNKAPAFDAAALPFFYSVLGDPRLRSYELSVKVNF